MKDLPVGFGTLIPDWSSNPTQRAFLASPRRHLLFNGGFGSGKSTACAFKGHFLNTQFPNNIGAVIRSTYRDLHDTTRQAYFEICQPDQIRYWKESDEALTYKNGSITIFRHFENGKPKVGTNLGWFFLDQAEEAGEEIYLGLLGRLRRPMPALYAMLAMNPNGEDWQYRRWIKNPEPTTYEYFECSTHENKHNLPPGYIEELERSYSREWIERFVYGKWSKMSGLIYHEFDEDRHLVDPFPIPTSWVKGRGMDWGIDAPATCVFVAKSPDGTFYAFDEYGDREKTPEEHAKAILEMSKQYGVFRASVMDSQAFSRGDELKSVADKYRAAGLTVQPATKDLMASILTIKHLLKTDRLKFVRDRTERTIEEIRKWKWGAPQKGKEVPARGNDHYLDAKRYILHWMIRRMFGLNSGLEDAPRRQTGRLTAGVASSENAADPVTGLPN